MVDWHRRKGVRPNWVEKVIVACLNKHWLGRMLV